mgnify:CR=1 FL=1
MHRNRRFKSIILVVLTFLLVVGAGLTGQALQRLEPDKILAESSTAANGAIQARETVSDSGLVKVSKTATPVAGMVNQWDITLRVEAKQPSPPPTTDIVLIVDTSGSMDPNQNVNGNGPDRIGKAKEAAISFANQLLTADSNVRIALVTFATTVSNYTFTPIAANDFESSESFVGFSRKGELISEISGLTATGGTFTQGGIKAASELLQGSDAQSKNVILISDGAPTFSYMLKEPYSPDPSIPVLENKSITDKTYYQKTDIPEYLDETSYETLKDIPQEYMDYSRVTRAVSGYAYYDYLGSNPTNSEFFYLNKAYNALSEASYLKNAVGANGKPVLNNFYTIGVDLDQLTLNPVGIVDPIKDPYIVATAKQVLTETASSPSKFYDINTDDLSRILTEIGESIEAPLQDGVVTDPMGTGFAIEGTVGNSSATEGTVTTSVDALGKETIKWTFDELTQPISATDETVYGELTYRVSANNDVLQNGVIDSAGLAKTNGVTTLDYRTPENTNESLDFIVPEVKPIIVSVSKVLKDSSGAVIANSPEHFSVKYGDDGYTVNDSFSIQANQAAKQIVHPWKADQPYSVEELLTSTQDYEVSIDINGVQTQGNKATWQFSSVYEEYEHQNIVITNTVIVRSKTVYLNIRQTVLRPNQDLVVPEKAFYEGAIAGTTTELYLTSGSTIKDTASEVNQGLFKRYQVTLEEGQSIVDIADIIPEYYQFYGYILTSDGSLISSEHISTNTGKLQKNNLASIDYSSNNEYWLTMFVEPKLGTTDEGEGEESPRFYSWDYKTNIFGQ